MSSFPRMVRVIVNTREEWERLALQAKRHGADNVDDYLQDLTTAFGSVRARADLVEQLHAQGFTTVEICERTGLTRAAVRERLRVKGLPANKAAQR